MRGTRILAGALLIAGLAAGPGWCAAADGLDSLATEALRHQLEFQPLARVTGPWGAVRLTDPRVTAAGLEFLAARPDTPGTDPAPLPKPIPLAQVYAVEIQTNSAGKGVLLGGLLGAAAGLAAAAGEDQIEPLGNQLPPTTTPLTFCITPCWGQFPEQPSEHSSARQSGTGRGSTRRTRRPR